MDVIIKKDGEYPKATINFDQKVFKGVVGKNGSVSEGEKKEGDAKTPIGGYGIIAVYYRPDKVEKPQTSLPIIEIKPNDIWVDESTSPFYNQPAKESDIKPDVSHEKLWRDDHLYDIFLDLDYNRHPAIPGKGSAIFMHIARDQEDPSNTPTAGCIALKQNELVEIIQKLDANSRVVIEG